MSLEAGNRRKSPVTLAVTTGYFFSLKKIMRENLVSAIQRTVRVSTDQHVYVCRSLQINIATYPLNTNNIVIFRSSERRWNRRRRGTELSGLHILVFFLFFFFLVILRWVPNDALQNYKRFSYTGAHLSNTLWRRRAIKDVNKVHWTAFSKSKESTVMQVIRKTFFT